MQDKPGGVTGSLVSPSRYTVSSEPEAQGLARHPIVSFKNYPPPSPPALTQRADVEYLLHYHVDSLISCYSRSRGKTQNTLTTVCRSVGGTRERKGGGD